VILDSAPPDSAPQACPPPDVLARFVVGGVSGAQLDTLEHHVDACSACRQGLAAIVRGQAAMPRLGRYRVDGILGAGGMGIVYRGFDPELRRPVAIKVVRPGHDEGVLGLRARLGREAEAMARLSHRNVCQVYDIGAEADEVWVAIELIEGGSLRQWMASSPPLPDVLTVMTQVCDGLAAAHAVGMCHRDVKPDNVLVERGGRAVLTDFGLARPMDVGVKSTVVAGTLAYMAPELLEGGAPDARSDQYALAVTLHEALTGVRPRHGVVATGLPAGLRAVLVRALAVDPAARFGSVAELGAALRDQAAPAAPPRDRAWPIAVAAAGVLLAASVTGVVLWRRSAGGAAPADAATVATSSSDHAPLAREPGLTPPALRDATVAPPILVGGGGGLRSSAGSAAPATSGGRGSTAPATTSKPSAGSAATAAAPPSAGGSGAARAIASGGGGASPSSDVRSIAPPANLSAVDAFQTWRDDYKAAQAAFGSARPMQLQAYPVSASGIVNIKRDRGAIISSFLSSSAKPGVPSDQPCGRSRMTHASGTYESDLYVTSCGRSFAFPRCTMVQIWRKAIAAGADPAIPANITYFASGWGFRQDVGGSFTSWDFKDADCASTGAAGSGTATGSAEQPLELDAPAATAGSGSGA
jgi:hypothetical protein